MVIGLFQQVFKSSASEQDETAAAEPCDTMPSTADSDNMATYKRVKCGKQCGDNLNLIYLILATLATCVFVIDVLLVFYVNRVTDLAVLQSSLQTDYIKEEIRQIVRLTLRDLRDEEPTYALSER